MNRALARRIGLHRVRPLVLGTAVALALVAAGLLTLLLSPLGEAWDEGERAEVERVQAFADADQDGLSDAVENRIGSDRSLAHTLGGNVSDGWLHHWFPGQVDWNDTSILDWPVMAPPRENLPEALRGPDAFPLPTVRTLHAIDAARWEPGGTGAWWTEERLLDPHEWDNDGDSIADAWLVSHGIHPLDAGPDSPAPGDESMTLQEKYASGLDPTRRDTDGDGLTDLEEISGSAAFGNDDRQFDSTDARAFSSRGDGIADGFLVRFGLDPHDPEIGGTSPAGDDITVAEAYAITWADCEQSSPAGCGWRQRLANGPLVDPTTWDSLGDGTADAWDIQQTDGLAHPLRDARSVVVHSTKFWDAEPWNGDVGRLQGIVVDDVNPRPDGPSEVTLLDLYRFLRPASWSEPSDGPWWGGLDTRVESEAGALPVAVALRGWTIEVNTCLGCNASEAPNPQELVLADVTADPRKSDTDGDGLSDLQEYFGIDPEGAPMPRTDPSDPDTDGDGLTDLEEAGEAGIGTDPLRRDSSGSFLTDGQEADYWTQRYDEAVSLLANNPVAARETYDWLRGPGQAPGTLSVEHLSKLLPKGSLHGETPNILSADSDGDGLTDGGELVPNRFLGRPSSQIRPATDPARVDSDGDGLDDDWEVFWSQDRYFGCADPCKTATNVTAWPIDPSLTNSIDPDATDVTDWDINLAGDVVRFDPHQEPASFSNGLAFLYGLHPFEADTSGDNITDMFAIHWGVEHIEGWAQETIRDLLEGGDAQDHAWLTQGAQRVADRLAKRDVLDPVPFVVIDPTASTQEVGVESNLLGMFSQREKGTWVYEREPCDVTLLPGASDPDLGHRHEDGGMEEGADQVPRRTGLEAPCWKWTAYPLSGDIEHQTNPWLHDFDADGLPDAWEAAYGDGDIRASRATPASVAAGCDDPSKTRGLPALGPTDNYCLTFLQAYSAGTDPRAGDTDEGGLPDWLEITLGLSPLDPLDDRGEEDWDGDGLLNWVEDELGTSRLSPDSDRDGLLDGDWVGKNETEFVTFENGNGNLCLRRGSDDITPHPGGYGGMEHRPFQLGLGDGNMTHTQRFDWYLRSGILHDDQPGNRCPAPEEVGGETNAYVLFKREVAIDGSTVLGAGQGTDPLAWDTSGNGLPDGWLVYWRDHAGQSDAMKRALDPNNPDITTDPDLQDPDGDIPTRQEYLAFRPDGWDEASDGAWWGGLDPTWRDTDGDEQWFTSVFPAADGLDLDGDNDGMPSAKDPFPGVDLGNGAIIDWNATGGAGGQGGFETDYGRLWDALRDRPMSSFSDRDGDTVPDFIDRARVQIVGVEAVRAGVPITELVKSEAPVPFEVHGMAVVAEDGRGGTSYEGPDIPADAAGDGAPVANATVRAILSSGPRDAVIGVGFTDTQGRFVIEAAVAPTTPPVSLPIPNASVDGDLFRAGGPVVLPSTVLQLEPGQVELRVTVEANDPSIQPVGFDGVQHAIAFKDVDGSSDRFRIPNDSGGAVQGPALRAARIGTDASGAPAPDLDAHHVRHAAQGIFEASSERVPLTLQAIARLQVAAPPTAVRVGEDLLVTGVLLDSAGAPLPGRGVNVTLHQDGSVIAWNDVEVLPDGSYAATFSTDGLLPGTYEARAHATLLPGDEFLVAPPDDAVMLSLVQDTTWSDIIDIDGRGVHAQRGSTTIEADQGFRIMASLSDVVTGEPVAGRNVTLRLESVDTDADLGALEASTGPSGLLDVTVPPLDARDVPLEFIRLDIEAARIMPADEAARAEIFLRPVFPTFLTVQNATADVGETATLTGTVNRGTPDAAVAVPSAGGDVVVAGNGTSHTLRPAAAGFSFEVESAVPRRTDWTLHFDADPDGFLKTSAPTSGHALHQGPTDVHVDTTAALRGQPVEVRGALLQPDGDPVAGARIDGRWVDLEDVIRATTDADGHFEVLLPPRGEAGTRTLRLVYGGSAIHHPTSIEQPVQVRIPTRIELTAPAMTVSPNGAANASVEGGLTDDAGTPLPGRAVDVAFTDPQGGIRSVEAVTDSGGAFSISAADVGPAIAGAWHVNATYVGSGLHAPTTAHENLTVVLQAALDPQRIPAIVVAGQSATLRGEVAAAGDVGPVEITVRLSGRVVATTMAEVGKPWVATMHVPDVDAGLHRLTFTGTAGPHVEVVAAQADVRAVGLLDLEVTERNYPDGSREIIVQVSGDTKSVPSGVGVLLVRKGDDGHVRGLHSIMTDDTGQAVLKLGAGETGNVTVVALTGGDIALEGLAYSSVSQPVSTDGGRSVWILAAGAAGILCAGTLAAYIGWKKRHQRRIGEAFHEAHLSLLDPDASAAEIIRRTYIRLLGCLEGAGFVVQDTQTARDITEATQAFGLPRQPMDRVTGLFERAVYSSGPLAPRDRDDALRAFAVLAGHVEPGRGGP